MESIKKVLSVDKLAADMRLGENIYDTDGKVLLADGIILKKPYIARIKELKVAKVKVYFDERIKQIVDETEFEELPETILPEDLALEGTMSNLDSFDFDGSAIYGNNVILNSITIENIVEQSRETVKASFIKFRFEESLNPELLLKAITQIVERILESEDVLIHLVKIRNTDDYLFNHSVNVSVLSIVVGISMGLNREQLITLGMGAILHDIGKLMVPLHILNKPDDLTASEFDEVKKHTLWGFNIAKELKYVNEEIADVILNHHERVDGLGYPYGRKKKDISLYAKIVSVADVFDAITSDRVYRDRIDPYSAVEFIISDTEKSFDEEVVRIFLKIVGYYPIGLNVVLNNGIHGIIMKKNFKKPTLKVLFDEDRKPVDGYYEVDLYKNPTMYINDFKFHKKFNERS